KPACVKACPVGARHYGDLGDANSAVSKLVAERGGYDLFPEMGYKPVNKYLPPRPRRDATTSKPAALPKPDGSAFDRLFAWADKLLSGKDGASTSSTLEG
ncbi:MAG: (Fe-S)-binding protein, partial [Alphaproteobacteria bacterium]|nr:(Fe-S)-binding protein [Alphaproteobacteria bacterium]